MGKVEAESSGCVSPAGDVANNKPKDVTNACYNISQAQKCISPCVLPTTPHPARHCSVTKSSILTATEMLIIHCADEQ